MVNRLIDPGFQLANTTPSPRRILREKRQTGLRDDEKRDIVLGPFSNKVLLLATCLTSRHPHYCLVSPRFIVHPFSISLPRLFKLPSKTLEIPTRYPHLHLDLIFPRSRE